MVRPGLRHGNVLRQEGTMATVHPSHHWYDLSIHRRWEDFASLAIAVLVLLAPMFIAETYDANVHIVTGAIAAFIGAIAMLETVSIARWEEVLELIAGICLFAAPFVLGYSGALATWHMVAGVLVACLAVLELWQDRRMQM
jgi:hypothetical protein